MKCCCWVRLLSGRKRREKVLPDVDSTCRGSQLEHKRSMSIHYEKNNLSITILSDEQNPEELKKLSKPHASKKASLPVGKARPKVYSVMKGTNSICHTPVPDKSPVLQPRKLIIRKGEPQSALLVSDSAAKKELLRLKAGRSHSEDRGTDEVPVSSL